MPPFLIPFLVCLGLWLLFPKSFKFMVGCWVGAIFGGFLWGFVGAVTFALGADPSLAMMGWSFAGFISAGIVVGCIVAAKG